MENINRYLIKPGTKIIKPMENGYCKQCMQNNGVRPDYCKAVDNACEKVLSCMAFFYKGKK